MNSLLAGLGARERFVLVIGLVLVALLLLWALLWKPLGDRIGQMRTTVAEQAGVEQWMQASAREVRQLRGSQTTARADRQSLLALTDRTARERGLGASIRRVEPEGSDKVRIQLEQAPFDDMMTWLEQLVIRHQVRVESVTIDSRDQAGVVNARLTLESPSS